MSGTKCWSAVHILTHSTSQQPYEGKTVYILQRQGHIVWKWQSQDLEPEKLIRDPIYNVYAILPLWILKNKYRGHSETQGQFTPLQLHPDQ